MPSKWFEKLRRDICAPEHPRSVSYAKIFGHQHSRTEKETTPMWAKSLTSRLIIKWKKKRDNPICCSQDDLWEPKEGSLADLQHESFRRPYDETFWQALEIKPQITCVSKSQKHFFQKKINSSIGHSWNIHRAELKWNCPMSRLECARFELKLDIAIPEHCGRMPVIEASAPKDNSLSKLYAWSAYTNT